MKNLKMLVIFLFCFYTGFCQYTLEVEGGYLVLEGNTSMVLKNAQLINNGSVEAGGSTVSMIGDAPNTEAKIGGSQRPIFYNLKIDKTANDIQLLTPITVKNELQMTDGNIDISANNIILDGEASIIGESDDSYIYSTHSTGGSVIKSANLATPNSVNPGNIGITFNSNENIGLVTIIRFHTTVSINGQNSIKRFYDIYATNDVDYNADIRLHYVNADLSGIDESRLEIFRLPDTGVWQYYETMAADQNSNYVEASGIHSFATRWALSESDVKLKPIVLFEGSYTGSGLMRDDLRTQGILPTTEPFTGLGFNHVGGGGEKVESAVFEATGDDAIVDWVLLQARDKDDNTLVLRTRSALLQRDGDIVDLNGVAPASFPGLGPNQYYLAVLHRNHLGVMSSTTTSINRTPSTYDFTLDPFDTEGGLLGVADLGDGFYGMFSGDHNANGQIQNTDAVSLTNSIGLAGYLQGDIDLNGQVQNSELQLKLVPNIGKGAQFNY